MVGAEHQEKGISYGRIPVLVRFIFFRPAQEHTEAPGEARVPIAVVHLFPIRLEPSNVLNFRPSNAPALEKLPSSQNGFLLAKMDEIASECQQVFLSG